MNNKKEPENIIPENKKFLVSDWTLIIPKTSVLEGEEPYLPKNLARQQGFKCQSHYTKGWKNFYNLCAEEPFMIDKSGVPDSKLMFNKNKINDGDNYKVLCLCQVERSNEQFIYHINTRANDIANYEKKIKWLLKHAPKDLAAFESTYGVVARYHSILQVLRKCIDLEITPLARIKEIKKNPFPQAIEQPQDDCFIIDPPPLKRIKTTTAGDFFNGFNGFNSFNSFNSTEEPIQEGAKDTHKQFEYDSQAKQNNNFFQDIFFQDNSCQDDARKHFEHLSDHYAQSDEELSALLHPLTTANNNTFFTRAGAPEQKAHDIVLNPYELGLQEQCYLFRAENSDNEMEYLRNLVLKGGCNS